MRVVTDVTIIISPRDEDFLDALQRVYVHTPPWVAELYHKQRQGEPLGIFERDYAVGRGLVSMIRRKALVEGKNARLTSRELLSLYSYITRVAELALEDGEHRSPVRAEVFQNMISMLEREGLIPYITAQEADRCVTYGK